MKGELISMGYSGVGRGWLGKRFESPEPESHRIHISSKINSGIKPAIGRRHMLSMSIEEAEQLIPDLERLIADAKYHINQHASA